MHISKVHIEGFKTFENFSLELDKELNIIVGDNETGKTSLLEAINLALTGQLDGRNIQYDLNPYLFNAKIVSRYFGEVKSGALKTTVPRILIEAYLEDDDSSELARLKGTNNSEHTNCPGLYLLVEPNEDFADDFREYAKLHDNPNILPTEYFTVAWRSFADNSVATRNLPFRATIIDTSLARGYLGPNKCVSRIISDVLDDDQRRLLSLAYRKLKHSFLAEPGITQINERLATKKGDVTDKQLTVSMDMSARSTWESAIAAHLDDIPFDLIGKGEQCRVQMKLAIQAADDSNVLLIEEPENHLSHSNMGRLIDEITNKGDGRQVILTTHSNFVLNKLGIDKLKLLSAGGKSTTLAKLSQETKDYFMKLPGYNTLRLILSKASILVEGPSDELIVQKAYKVQHGKLPLEDGIDVIAVGSLAFKRFLEIAALLKLNVRVVTDNDGDVAALTTKYTDYLNQQASGIRICYDSDTTCPTLEPQLLKANSRPVLNRILKTKYGNDADLLAYMAKNKTDCALKVFISQETVKMPTYIENAIAK